MNPMHEKWARVLVQYSTASKLATGHDHRWRGSEPLLRAIYREVIPAGGLPTMLPTFPEWTGDLLRLGNDAQLGLPQPNRSLRQD